MSNKDRRIDINELPQDAEAKLSADDIQDAPAGAAEAVKGGERYSGFRYDGLRIDGARLDGYRKIKRTGFITGDGGGTWKL